MQIKYVQIKNFRGFTNLEIEFPDSMVVVFIGINEVGKTSLLDCLAMFLSQFSWKLTENKLTEKKKKQSEFPLTVDDININGATTRNTIKVYDAALEKEISWEIAYSVEKRSSASSRELEEYIKHFHDILSENPYYNLPIVCYYQDTRRLAHKKTTLKKYNSAQFYAYEDAFEKDANNFHEFIYWFEKEQEFENQERLKNGLKFKSRDLDAVRRAIKQFFSKMTSTPFSEPRIELAKREGAYRYRQYENQYSSEIVITTDQGNLKVSQLSAGRKMLFLMVGDLAHRLATANPKGDPLQGNGVVLIDEIDLHLHPRWQREVLPALRLTFPQIQFIVSTHSPLVVSSVEAQEVIKISEDHDDTTLYSEDISYKHWQLDFILRDVMDLIEQSHSEAEELISQLSDSIDEQNLEKYESLLAQLETMLHPGDPILTNCRLARADFILHRKEQ